MLGKLRMFPLQQVKYQVAVGSPVLPVAHPDQPTVGIAFSKSPSILLSPLDSHDSKSTVPLKKFFYFLQRSCSSYFSMPIYYFYSRRLGEGTRRYKSCVLASNTWDLPLVMCTCGTWPACFTSWSLLLCGAKDHSNGYHKRVLCSSAGDMDETEDMFITITWGLKLMGTDTISKVSSWLSQKEKRSEGCLLSTLGG